MLKKEGEEGRGKVLGVLLWPPHGHRRGRACTTYMHTPKRKFRDPECCHKNPSHHLWLTHDLCYSVQKPVAAVILGILLINMLRCVVRSGEWRSEDRLFRSALSVCPLNAKVPCPPDSSSKLSLENVLRP